MGLEDCDSVLVSLGSGDIGISHLVSSVFISRENKLMPKPPADCYSMVSVRNCLHRQKLDRSGYTDHLICTSPTIE